MMMGPPPLMYYRDDFNRANSASLGSDWGFLGASGKIDTNAAQQKTMANGNGNNGCWNRYQGGPNGGQLLTDNWRVRAVYKPPVGAAATNMLTMLWGAEYTDAPSAVTVYGGTVASTAANGAGIVTQSGNVASPYNPSGQSGQTSRSVVNGLGTGTFEVIFERKGRLFQLFKDGVLATGWNDTGDVVAKGVGYRGWGFITQGNYPFFQQNFYSHALEWIEAYDIPA